MMGVSLVAYSLCRYTAFLSYGGSPLCECLTKRGLGADRLCSGVDRAVADLWVVCPEGNQTAVEHHEFSVPVLGARPNRRHWLSGGVSWRGRRSGPSARRKSSAMSLAGVRRVKRPQIVLPCPINRRDADRTEE